MLKSRFLLSNPHNNLQNDIINYMRVLLERLLRGKNGINNFLAKNFRLKVNFLTQTRSINKRNILIKQAQIKKISKKY